MNKKDGYKATRKSVAQRREETRRKIWENSDALPRWEQKLSNKEIMRELLLRIDKELRDRIL